jgi:ATP-dependent helicase/nuclease subunit A
MDRVFLTSEGARWVVDYKISRHQGSDLEGFLQQEAERYKRQLIGYGEAVRTDNLGIYFPMVRGWRVIQK